MFHAEMIESRQKQIEIKDISCRAFDLLLQYAYKGKVQVTDDNAQPLLYAASILQMDHVCRSCESFLTHYLTVDNCLSVRQFAEMHNCVDLMRSIDQFVRDRFLELRTKEDFLQIGLKYLSELVDSPDLFVKSEDQVFEAVVSWLEEDLEERAEYAFSLLSKIRLTQLPAEFLLNKVLNHPIVEVKMGFDLKQCKAKYVANVFFKKDVTCLDLASKALQKKCIQCGFAPSSSAGQLAVWDANSSPRKSVAGVVFCVGGRGTNGDPFRSVEAYDWRKDRWMAVAEMHTKRRHVGVIAAHGKLYAIGGHDGVEHLNSVEVRHISVSLLKYSAYKCCHFRCLILQLTFGK